ncbi:PqqD family peptide modification chaperone [Candidatus Thiodictyon syntrophicum]|jgi:radical SAM protein with 4Fe4S-binding SPASM domain|uniref:Radical SAM core domain-containing protein n=1 Tax=Candidatus Thiodictyon syntrophicum TaxID=1166950 RepID=A0A2K8UHN0_9GAMM|nr:PqqD family peptide modification chaperone [Candidatus Thiodictyon syntrophicum]AUB85055.1 hypothetical protein THSYN_29415 [Candidatus Thiodictyon syntrophicum]
MTRGSHATGTALGIHAALPEGHVILTDRGSMLFLNETAAAIFQMLADGVVGQEAVQEICEQYDIGHDVALRDLEITYASFRTLGLIEHNGDPAEALALPMESKTDPRKEVKKYCSEHSLPLQAFIEITTVCNLRCKHCYIPDVGAIGPLKDPLNISELRDLLKQLRELSCLEVTLTGGEPLMARHLIETCAYARQLGFSVILKTNATLLTEAFVAELRRLHVTEVQVSLYSMDAATHDVFVRQPGSHARTVAGLRLCHALGQRCRISCVVTRSNYQQLDGLKEFATSIDAPIGFDLLVTRRLDGTDDPLIERLTEDDLIWLDQKGVMSDVIFEGSTNIAGLGDQNQLLVSYPIDDPESPICGAANTMVAINVNGDVRPCIAFPYRLGNIREQPLREILSDRNEPTRQIRSYRNRSFTECVGCELIPACPRCMATTYQETGNPVGKADAICRIAQYHRKYGGPPSTLEADGGGTV